MQKPLVMAFGVTVLLGLSNLPLTAGVTVWVAKDGIDTADGTEAHPFSTLERAREAIRAVILHGETGEVVIHGGTYELAAPLTLEGQDSGTATAPVVWRAAQGEEVRLSAGRQVSGWHPVSDPAVLTQLAPNVRSSVLETDLKAQGITDFGEMSGGFGLTGSTGLELFVNDKLMSLSRYPQNGFMTIVEPLGGTRLPHTIQNNKEATVEGVLRVSDPRIAHWVHEKDPRVMGYWFWDWADERQKIVAIDPATQTITLDQPWHKFGYREGQYFYAYNLLCELNQPDEWYLDRGKSILYLFSAGAVIPARSTVSLLPSVVVMNGANHVTLSHLIFEGARGDALVMTNCEGSEAVGDTFRNCGKWGVRIEGGHDCSVRSSTIFNTGDGGVSLLGGDRATLTLGNHEVVNCDIHDYSRWDRTYQPGIRLEGVGCRAAHNLIYAAPHQAISFQGNDQVIEYNEIHDVCEETNDAGAIYAWNDWAARGNQIRYNYIHDIHGRLGKGANGVYLDDCFSSAVIEGNVFVSVTRPIHLGGGRDNCVLNNLFVNCTAALHIDARGLGWRAYGFDELKQKLEQWPYQTPPWSQRYPELTGILADDPMAPKGIVVARNIMVSTQWDDIEKKALPYITMKDNIFDAPHDVLDYSLRAIPRLKAALPVASAIRFETIPSDKIGLTTSDGLDLPPGILADKMGN